MEVPDVIIIGAPRSGTTSLYRYLDEHPEVFMSPLKETRFFAYEGKTVDYDGPADAHAYNRDTVTDAAAYRQLFSNRISGQCTGEATPVYLYRGSRAAERIQRYTPDTRLVAIFRNPVERAYSDFLNMVRLGWEPVHDFEEALALEKERIADHWSPYYHYQAKGFYADQVRTYLQRFDREQIKFFLFEDLKRDAAAVMEDLFAFVGVDPSVSVSTGTRHNRSGLPRSGVAHRLLTHPLLERVMRGPLRTLRTTLRDWNTAHGKPPLDPEIRADLRETYRDDIQNLQKIIDRDLSHWLS
jgi:hypothetical protein